jgi:hypothetical protein
VYSPEQSKPSVTFWTTEEAEDGRSIHQHFLHLVNPFFWWECTSILHTTLLTPVHFFFSSVYTWTRLHPEPEIQPGGNSREKSLRYLAVGSESDKVKSGHHTLTCASFIKPWNIHIKTFLNEKNK